MNRTKSKQVPAQAPVSTKPRAVLIQDAQDLFRFNPLNPPPKIDNFLAKAGGSKKKGRHASNLFHAAWLSAWNKTLRQVSSR
jgi:thioredoxin-like negative regulator of GroEL